VKIEHYS